MRYVLKNTVKLATEQGPVVYTQGRLIDDLHEDVERLHRSGAILQPLGEDLIFDPDQPNKRRRYRLWRNERTGFFILAHGLVHRGRYYRAGTVLDASLEDLKGFRKSGALLYAA